MSEKLEAALIGLLNEHQSLGNGKARELLGLDEAAYESLKAELLAKGLIATGRGRGGSIKLAKADQMIRRSDDQKMKNAAEPKAMRPHPRPLSQGEGRDAPVGSLHGPSADSVPPAPTQRGSPPPVLP